MKVAQVHFRGILDPSDDLLGQLSDLAPENPFCTKEYALVRKTLGYRPVAIILEDRTGIVSGCLAFFSSGRLNSRMEITSLPALDDRSVFWPGLFKFCRDQNIAVLNIQTFGSTKASFPIDPSPEFQKNRCEFRLDLSQPDLWNLIHRRHRRLIKKAYTAGLELRLANDRASLSKHCELANSSLARRRGKGESVDGAITGVEVIAFVESGCGEIYQAVGDGEVLSTILIARSRTGCYAQSSGTAEPGRTLGASHFLFHEVALRMKAEGLEVFNVGGADEHSVGLQEFKQGQGTIRIELGSAEYFTGSTVKRLASRAVSLLRR